MDSSADSYSSSSDEGINEKVTKAKRPKKTKKVEITKEKKAKKGSNTNDPFNVQSLKNEYERWIYLGKKDAIVLNNHGQLGFAKYKLNKPNEKPQFFYIFELEPDSVKHLLEASKQMVDFKEKTKK